LTVLESVLPPALIKEVVAVHAPPTRRCRLLPYEVTLLLVIAMNLFAMDALPTVLAKLLAGLRVRCPDTVLPATTGAISQARQRVGIAPVVALFHRLCQPLATTATIGASLFDLRLMAVDGTTELVADTPANVRAFGRHRSQYGPSAYPFVQVVALVECGTHAIVDAIVGPGCADPHRAARRLLRSVGAGMLLLWDCGLYSVQLVWLTRCTGADILCRVGSSLCVVPEQGLADGSYLTRLHLAPPSRRRPDTPSFLVRIIVYTLTDPCRPGYQETHRLLTSLLDPIRYPARDLILAYHERWEIELVIDELDTHQRPVNRPLRSRLPTGVIQEVYGLLIAHYLVRATMHAAACAAGCDPDRLSFTHSLGVVVTLIPLAQVSDTACTSARRLLLADVARIRLPPRALRTNPRVVKRKSSKFRHKAPDERGVILPLPFVHAIHVIPMGAAVLPQARSERLIA
jgi:hypothetical protein